MGYEVLHTDGGEITTLLVTKKDNSSFTVMHSQLEKGASAPIHYHERDYEAFYVLSGKIRFIAGIESQYMIEAGSGMIVVCPPYCTRSFHAIKDSVMIVVNYPSGPAEDFMRDMTSVPSNKGIPPKHDDIKRYATRYGIHVMKPYTGKDIRPNIADLSKDGQLVVGELCFSHGSDNDYDHKKKTLWLFACNIKNKLPHSIPIGSDDIDTDIFCVGRAP